MPAWPFRRYLAVDNYSSPHKSTLRISRRLPEESISFFYVELHDKNNPQYITNYVFKMLMALTDGTRMDAMGLVIQSLGCTSLN